MTTLTSAFGVCSATPQRAGTWYNHRCGDVWSYNREYKPGFTTLIESETFAKGLDETVVRAISAKKREPVRLGLNSSVVLTTYVFLWRMLCFTLNAIHAVVACSQEASLLQEWMLEFRLKAYRKWLTMAEPAWSDNR